MGKIRQLHTGSLWLQKHLLRNTIAFQKIKGTLIPSDMFTKYSLREAMEGMPQDTPCSIHRREIREGSKPACAHEEEAPNHGARKQEVREEEWELFATWKSMAVRVQRKS